MCIVRNDPPDLVGEGEEGDHPDPGSFPDGQAAVRVFLSTHAAVSSSSTALAASVSGAV